MPPKLAIALVFVVIASRGAGPLNPIIGVGAWSAMSLGMLIGGVLTEAFGVYPCHERNEP